MFAPIVWLMGRRLVSTIGKRVYEYVAENRSHHFVCAYDPDRDAGTDADAR